MMRYVVLILGISLWLLWAFKCLKEYMSIRRSKKSIMDNASESFTAFIVLHIVAITLLFIIACIIWW